MKWSDIDENARLSVEYEKEPEKHKGACQYAVVVAGVRTGRLYRDYHEGFVAARMCVGGSMPGYNAWYFEPEPDLDAALDSGHPFFMPPDQEWLKLKEAQEHIRQRFNRPSETRLFQEHERERTEVKLFMAWLRWKVCLREKIEADPE